MSRNRECQDCKYKFKISTLVEKFQDKNMLLPIYCPRCDSDNIAVID